MQPLVYLWKKIIFENYLKADLFCFIAVTLAFLFNQKHSLMLLRYQRYFVLLG